MKEIKKHLQNGKAICPQISRYGVGGSFEVDQYCNKMF